LSRPAALEKRLGYRFTRSELLEQALSHKGKRLEGNERLEFLGDGVLDCVMAEEVYTRYPSLREGELHRLQESLVREEALAEVARHLALDETLKPALPFIRPSTLADTLEAIFGAVFLDGGYGAARATILRVFEPFLERLDPQRLDRDAKSKLQEIVQARFKSVPVYRILRSQGAAHEKVFEVECAVAELKRTAVGSGLSRQRAEQDAARAMLQQIDKP
jgi:ribonuclease III